MKTLTTLAMITALLLPTFASATPVEEEPPVVVVEPREPARHDRTDVVGAVALMTLFALAAVVYNNQKAETANCDGISDQTIFGADGKPLVAPTTGLCD